VLKDVTFKISSEIKVIIGLNGSGKSTLLRIIAGIIKPDKGRIIING
jgi:molybdate transport system ATP-binding protein